MESARPQKRKRTSASTKSSTSSSTRPQKRPRSPSPAQSNDAESSTSSSTPAVDPMALLRAHFESQFEPIDIAPVVAPGDDDDDDQSEDGDEDEEEWDGISSGDSEAGDDDGVVVVHHQETAQRRMGEDDGLGAGISKAEMRAFLSGKLIPSSKLAAASTAFKSKRKGSDEDDSANPETEAANLKNDLALQRLLKESHLLDSSSTSLEATGKNRLKALDSRLDSLGLKPLEGQKHGWHLRKGIEGKKEAIEKARRKEARENGIILEKEVKKEVKRVKRVREMDAPGFAPAVGRFKNGALVLSKKDVRDIEGRRSGGGGKSGGRKGGKPRGKRRK